MTPLACLFVDPAEDRREDEALPWFKDEQASRLRAFDVGQHLDEEALVFRRLGIEDEREVRVGEVIDLTLAGLTHEFTGGDGAV